jgi:tetratricopeptide (TPR) repeat protein
MWEKFLEIKHPILIWINSASLNSILEEAQDFFSWRTTIFELLGNLGNAYSHLGEPRKAIEYHEQALKISREIDNKRGEGADLGNLGSVYSQLGKKRRAIEYYEQALKISREVGDRRSEGIYLGNLGLTYSDLGEIRKAIEFLKKPLL